ncbi:hypothetical protein HF324_01855 [Chitinophaga oryzae]|uniref:Galactosyltransferase C-terminal domain-containing protein n=1 Tax=Chitinophaga oryzae TaxID=2725414 RepID=A0ABX6L9F3_9BACT|nr:galactosyltransferase-related protein [Chitinophaga oryzae]QJB36672.1 hypothetical protein HF324_01855 [Chitinophaga oryzae]
MIFLSAQPCNYYFLWQLELQVFNFRQLGIPAEKIHVLIGYDPQLGLSEEFAKLMQENTAATFYTYPDVRIKKRYLSSLRPHLIKQHFTKFPELCDEVVFYHDSDILFRELPDFSQMNSEGCWYLSDTRTYLDSNYVRSTADTDLFYGMCALVGISPDVVIAHDQHAGGAQYLISNVQVAFWEKLEKDCEGLYALLEDFHNKKAAQYYKDTGQAASRYRGIQVWCADMWAMLYNALLFGYKPRIHHDLDFCWAGDRMSKWYDRKILHYSGVRNNQEGKMFCKTDYIHYPPYYADHSGLSGDFCGYAVVECMKLFLAERSHGLPDLKDVTFVIPLKIDSMERRENLLIVVKFISTHFNTNILVLEADEVPGLESGKLPSCCRYVFVQDSNKFLHRTRYNNAMISAAKTPFVVLCDTDIVVHQDQVTAAVALLRQGQADMVIPYDGEVLAVDPLFKKMFEKLQDISLLSLNRKKFFPATKRGVGGLVFLKKAAYVSAGMENEFIESWGPEDMERRKRMTILRFRVMHLSGPVYHLPHPRGTNSGYVCRERRIKYMEEYVKVCNMRKAELEEYIQSWDWLLSPKMEI